MEQPVVIVTGASYGLGAAIAAEAAAQGARVVMVARTGSRLEREALKIAQNGGTVCVVEADISRYPDCQRVIAQTLAQFGRIDGLINNAALVGPFSTVADVEPDVWRYTLEVNLFGPMQLCHEAVPYLRQSNGRVINVTSGAAEAIIPGGSAYCSSKAALNHFTRIFDAEEPKITVVLFSPGDMDTAMQAEIREKATSEPFAGLRQHFIHLYETGQLLRPETSARAAVALALHAPAAWTGQIISWDDERLVNGEQ